MTLLGFALTLALAASPEPVTVSGHTYAVTLPSGQTTLKLIGAGLRKKWFVDVYVLAAYTESGRCSPQTIIDAEEPKYLRIDMLRDVSAEKMASTIGEAFAAHMPADARPELKAQRDAFLASLREKLTTGTALDFTYVPGQGTVVRQNGRQLGETLVGPAFAHVLWDIYLGPESCCKGTKEQILRSCRE